MAGNKRLVDVQAPTEKKEQETPDAIYSRGLAYYKNEGWSQALKCFEQAADKGHVHAMYMLVYVLATAPEFKKNPKEAATQFDKLLRHYEDLEKKGQLPALAMHHLGNLYYNACGTAKNYAKAEQWFAKALEKDPNHTDAMYMRGCLYYNGDPASGNE